MKRCETLPTVTGGYQWTLLLLDILLGVSSFTLGEPWKTLTVTNRSAAAAATAVPQRQEQGTCSATAQPCAARTGRASPRPPGNRPEPLERPSLLVLRTSLKPSAAPDTTGRRSPEPSPPLARQRHPPTSSPAHRRAGRPPDPVRPGHPGAPCLFPAGLTVISSRRRRSPPPVRPGPAAPR